jgi:hypothetical protein
VLLKRENGFMLHSWEALEPVVLQRAGDVTHAFVNLGVRDYRAAARYIHQLPYGRNSNATVPSIVIQEGRGTCSTKHALLCRLALEQNLTVALMVGIYQMNERNTPGVGAVLQRYNLVSLPEAHCYLRGFSKRIDVTREIRPSEPIAEFIHEEEITPNQIGAYKTNLHRQFLRHWMEQEALAVTLEDLWSIREQCIAALSASSHG